MRYTTKLRIDCAAIMGAKWRLNFGEPSTLTLQTQTDDNFSDEMPQGKIEFDESVEDYPSSLDACKTLIEFVVKSDWSIDLSASPSYSKPYACVIGQMCPNRTFTAEGDTPELAICKAFFKWKQRKEKK